MSYPPIEYESVLTQGLPGGLFHRNRAGQFAEIVGRAQEQARPAAGHEADDSVAPPDDQGQRPAHSQWLILAVVLVGSFMAVLDTTIVNVALPSIAVGTHAASAALEWIVSGYALAFAI